MLQDKTKLIARLNKHLIKKQNDTEYLQNYAMYLEDTFQVPLSLAMDLLQLREPLEDVGNKMLFWLAEGYDHFNTGSSLSKAFFTESEVENGYTEKMQVPEISMPLKFKMIQVDYDSYIGTISTEVLVQLQDSGYINYNDSTQRLLNMVFRINNVGMYKARINQNSVNAIKDLLHTRAFIPNTITLNIAPGTGVFEYNISRCELVIKELKNFDIIDGYHRLRAIISETHENPGFNYPMELRIVSYDIDKAKQFIYQEDQNNKMERDVSEVFNVVSPANKVVRKLNEDPACVFAGRIGLEKGKVIRHNEILPIITYLWFKGKGKANDQNWLLIANEIRDSLNDFTYRYTEYAKRDHIPYRELCAILYVYYLAHNGEEQIADPAATTYQVIEKIKDMPTAYFTLLKEKSKAKSFKVIKENI